MGSSNTKEWKVCRKTDPVLLPALWAIRQWSLPDDVISELRLLLVALCSKSYAVCDPYKFKEPSATLRLYRPATTKDWEDFPEDAFVVEYGSGAIAQLGNLVVKRVEPRMRVVVVAEPLSLEKVASAFITFLLGKASAGAKFRVFYPALHHFVRPLTVTTSPFPDREDLCMPNTVYLLVAEGAQHLAILKGALRRQVTTQQSQDAAEPGRSRAYAVGRLASA